MTNPATVTLAGGAWVKVLTNVKMGQVWIKKRLSADYQQTYRDTGDPAPTDLTDAVDFDKSGHMPVQSSVPIDVYVYNPDSEDGEARVDE